MLSNAYFLAKFRFDTAENEPAKNLQTIANFATFAQVRGAVFGAEQPLLPHLLREQAGRGAAKALPLHRLHAVRHHC